MASLQHGVARRLRAIRAEVGLDQGAMATALDVGRTRYVNWEGTGPSANMPAEVAMIRLCSLMPGVTLDYVYRGVLDAVPSRLAIRLAAREMGQDPDAPDFRPETALGAVAGAIRGA